MQYALLLYASESERQRSSEAEVAALELDRADLVALLSKSGRRSEIHALQHSTSATTVRLRGGRTLLCDGPFAETSEQLCGLLLVEARDLDEAIAIAERAPDARMGSVEIRPVRAIP